MLRVAALGALSMVAAGAAWPTGENDAPAVFAGYLAPVNVADASHGRTCLFFDVAATRPDTLLVFSRGLGTSPVAVAPQGNCPPPGKAWKQRAALRFARPFVFTRLAVQLEPSVLRSGAAVQGDVVALNSRGQAAIAPVSIAGVPESVPLTAAKWFFGLLAPALLTAAIGFAAARAKQWKDERDMLASFLQLEDEKIGQAGDELKAVLHAEHMEKPGQLAYEILAKHEILGALPRRPRKKIVSSCRNGHLTVLVNELRMWMPALAEKLD
ncbi:MAG TPA: hypothetical protein VGC56_18480 [Allosphingosinicella sp.]